MSAPARVPAATPWGLVILLGALIGMGPLAIDMYLPGLPALAADLKASPVQAQATLAAFLAGMAVGQFFYGPASDRLGRRGPILLGLCLFIVASVICATATSPAVLLAGRFLQALGACAGVISRAVVRDKFDHHETARVLSLLTLVMGMAPILAPLLGGFLLMVAGWRTLFWFMAAFGVVLGLFVVLRLGESRTEETSAQAKLENPFQAFGQLVRQRRVLGYTLGSALNSATLFTYISCSPELLIQKYGISPQAFGWVFGANAVGLITASQVNRYYLRRLTADQILGRAGTAAAGFAVLLAICAVTGFGGRWTILPLLFLIMSMYGFMQGNTIAGALNCDPKRAGSVSALQGGFQFVVGASAVTLVGALHDGTPRPMALVMLVALVGSAAALRWLAFPKEPAKAVS